MPLKSNTYNEIHAAGFTTHRCLDMKTCNDGVIVKYYLRSISLSILKWTLQNYEKIYPQPTQIKLRSIYHNYKIHMQIGLHQIDKTSICIYSTIWYFIVYIHNIISKFNFYKVCNYRPPFVSGIRYHYNILCRLAFWYLSHFI